MPVNNALAESINTGQSEDPFKRLTEFENLGNLQTRNRLMEAQIGEAGARAGEAGAAAALSGSRKKYQDLETQNYTRTQDPSGFTPLQQSERARTQSSLAEAEKTRAETARVNADNAGRIGNLITNGASLPEVQRFSTALGQPIPPDQYAQYEKNDALLREHGRNLNAYGMSSQQYLQPHPISSGAGFRTIGQETAQPPAPTPATPGTAPPSAGPAPPAAAPQAPAAGLGQAPISPQQKQLEVDAAKDFSGPSTKSYNGALDLQGRLAIINHNIDTLGPQWMGAGADTKAAFSKAWNSALDTAGLEGFHINPEKIATWEDFNKETTRAGMELIKSNFGGSREAASIIQMGRTAVPAVQNTYLGAKYVSATIGAAAQRQIDLHEYKRDLLAQGKSLVGADADFNKTHPAEDYARGAIAGQIPKTSVSKLLAGGPPDIFDTHYGPGMAQYILSHRPQ